MTTRINALNEALCAATGLTPEELGVQIGTWADRATWRPDFVSGETPERRAAAEAIVAAFDPSSWPEE